MVFVGLDTYIGCICPSAAEMALIGCKPPTPMIISHGASSAPSHMYVAGTESGCIGFEFDHGESSRFSVSVRLAHKSSHKAPEKVVPAEILFVFWQ